MTAQERSLLDGLRDGTWLDGQQFPPLRYHVPGILPEGLSVLAGAPKVGKSFIVLNWLLAIAVGGIALGGITTTPGDVLYAALEDGDRRMQARCRTLLGPRQPIPGRFQYLTDIVPHLLIPTLAEWLQLHPHGLAVVDTLGKVLPPARSGEDPYSRDYRVMGELKACADAFPGAGLLMSHHDRKAVSADFVDSVSGTHGIAGAADTVIILTRPRESADGLLQITGRDVTEGAYAVTFTAGSWALDGDGLDQAARNARLRRASMGLDDCSRDVISAVEKHADGARAADVATELGIDQHTARTYLARLADAGRITRAERGLYTPVADVASLRPGDDDERNTQRTPQSPPGLWP